MAPRIAQRIAVEEEEAKVAKLIERLECLGRQVIGNKWLASDQWYETLGCVMDILRCVYEIGDMHIKFYKRRERIGALLLPALKFMVYFAREQARTPVTKKNYEAACIYREALGLLVATTSRYRVSEDVDRAITEELEKQVDWATYDGQFKTYHWVYHVASFSRLFPPYAPRKYSLEQDMRDLKLK